MFVCVYIYIYIDTQVEIETYRHSYRYIHTIVSYSGAELPNGGCLASGKHRPSNTQDLLVLIIITKMISLL